MSLLSNLLGPPCTTTITLADASTRKKIEVLKDSESSERENYYVFANNDNVGGTAEINLKPGKKIQHMGIRIELLGQIEMFYDSTKNYDFTSLVKELAGPGELFDSKTFKFDFPAVEMPYESYNGINVRLRYILRLTIFRQYQTNIVTEYAYWVQNIGQEPQINNPIKMEVGIEDCLHIEFEYAKSKLHLKDVVVGKIYFLLVRIKIRQMEISLVRREATGSGANVYNESETITKFEIMDGAPVRGESVPVRIFLSAFDLTPTYRNINNKFSVKYYLNLVLYDEDDRRYFKQQEITLWRKDMEGTHVDNSLLAYNKQLKKPE